MRIASRIHDYQVQFADDTSFVAQLEAIPTRFYVIDAKVWTYYGDSTFATIDRERVLTLPADEDHKTIERVFTIYDALLLRTAKKNLTLISVGGGIIQDVTGYAASTLYRGVRWVYVPTTLLAQADSCIGSKTSLNYRGYKNMSGTFYPPHEIHVSSAFLGTLTDLDFFSGLGEVIKLHLIGGEEHTLSLLKEIDALRCREPAAVARAVHRSLVIKAAYLEEDEFDAGRRNLLNFGHCFGHALETTSEFTIPHGQAVLIGILFALAIARRRGLLSEKAANFLRDSVVVPNIVARPTRAQCEVGAVRDAMQKDKKRTGAGLPLVMLKDGYVLAKVDDLGEDELAAGIDEMAGFLQSGKKEHARGA